MVLGDRLNLDNAGKCGWKSFLDGIGRSRYCGEGPQSRGRNQVVKPSNGMVGDIENAMTHS